MPHHSKSEVLILVGVECFNSCCQFISSKQKCKRFISGYNATHIFKIDSPSHERLEEYTKNIFNSLLISVNSDKDVSSFCILSCLHGKYFSRRLVS